MPKKTATESPLLTPPPAMMLDKIKQQEIANTQPVLTKVQALKIIDNDSYALADLLLSKIRTARATWKATMARILDPIKKAKKEAEAVFNELDDPLEQGELQLREGMRQFKLKEWAEQQRIEGEKREEENRLRIAAQEKERLAEQAKTKTMQTRLQNQAAAIQTQADMVVAAPVAAPVKVASSTTRTVKKWRVVDMEKFLMGIVDGPTPIECIQVNTSTLTALFHQNRDEVATYPGVEVYEDVIIVGR